MQICGRAAKDKAYKEKLFSVAMGYMNEDVIEDDEKLLKGFTEFMDYCGDTKRELDEATESAQLVTQKADQLLDQALTNLRVDEVKVLSGEVFPVAQGFSLYKWVWQRVAYPKKVKGPGDQEHITRLLFLLHVTGIKPTEQEMEQIYTPDAVQRVVYMIAHHVRPEQGDEAMSGMLADSLFGSPLGLHRDAGYFLQQMYGVIKAISPYLRRFNATPDSYVRAITDGLNEAVQAETFESGSIKTGGNMAVDKIGEDGNQSLAQPFWRDFTSGEAKLAFNALTASRTVCRPETMLAVAYTALLTCAVYAATSIVGTMGFGVLFPVGLFAAGMVIGFGPHVIRRLSQPAEIYPVLMTAAKEAVEANGAWDKAAAEAHGGSAPALVSASAAAS